MSRTLSLITLLLLFFTGVAKAADINPIRKIAENGIVVLIMERPSLPIVSVQVLVRAGALYEPSDQAGLANMTASLLEEGTKRRSSKEIADAVDFIGARLSARGGKDSATVSLKVVKKDVATGFSLLSDILMHPAFASKEVERVRKNILGSILSEKDNPRTVARRAFQKLIFDQHPYHLPSIGLSETVSKIPREALVNFHASYYRPNNTIISIVGDVTEKEAMDLVKTHFGAWERKNIRFPKITPAQAVASKKIELIDKDLTQATILLGKVGIARNNPDYYPVTVMNYILGGGGFSSRMLKEIRDNQGLVYSVYSYFDASIFPGPFSVSLQTKNQSANKAIEGALSEIRRIRKEAVTDQELSEAKDYLMGSFPLRLDTTSKLANILTAIEYYDLGFDYFEKYPEYIGKVTKEDVLRVAKKHLDPDRYVLVVVGKQSDAVIKTD